MQLSSIRSEKMPRFFNRGNEVVYALFDAFVVAALIENRAIDFCVSPCFLDENTCKFDVVSTKFTDLLNLPSLQDFYKDEKSLRGDKELSDVLGNMRSGGQNVSDYELLFAHLNWLWSLGITIQTNCGGFVKNVNPSFEVKGGLWSACTGTARKPSDFKFMIDVFRAYYQCCTRPLTIPGVKKELEKIVISAYKGNSTPMANALLHYCNPDRHIHIFVSDVKKKIIADAISNGLYKSSINVSSATIDEIDEEICKFYDSIETVDTYEKIMGQYMYK